MAKGLTSTHVREHPETGMEENSPPSVMAKDKVIDVQLSSDRSQSSNLSATESQVSHQNGYTLPRHNIEEAANADDMDDHTPLLPKSKNVESESWTSQSYKRSLFSLISLLLLATAVEVIILKTCLPDVDPVRKGDLTLPRNLEQLQKLNAIMSEYIKDNFGKVLTSYVSSYLYLQAFSIPGSMWLSILGGALFNFWFTLFLVCLCSAVGATFAYFISYTLGSVVVQRKFGDRIARWNEQLEPHRRNMFNYIVVLRLIPFPPNWLANIGSPHLGVKVWPFFAGTFVGVAAPSFIHVQAGAAIDRLSSTNGLHFFTPINVLCLIAVGIVALIPVFGGCVSLPEDQVPAKTDTGQQSNPGVARSTTPSLDTAKPATEQSTSKYSGPSTLPQSPSESVSKPKFIFTEHNRRYHNEEASYVLPNDDHEVTRLQELHYLSRWGLDGDFHTPIKDRLEEGIKVLDIGCGPGTWVMEMATEFPNSHFTGIDISPIFPESIRPTNCHFQEANSLKGLPFPDNHFDFVYERLLEAGYTSANWTLVLSEIKRVTKPGGWVELVELDASEKSAGPLLTDLISTGVETLKARDLDVTIGTRLASLLEQCTDDKSTISVDHRSFPIGYGGRIGDMWANQIKVIFGGLHPIFEIKYGKMSVEEFRDRLDRAIEEGAQTKSYTDCYYGFVQVVKN